MFQDPKTEMILSETYLKGQIREIDEKIAEIEQAVDRLSDEEAKLLAQRAEKNSGAIEDIVMRSRENQRRLQDIRDFIEIEQAPLPELKGKREELFRQYTTLRRLKTKERLKAVIQRVDEIQAALTTLKQDVDAVDEML